MKSFKYSNDVTFFVNIFYSLIYIEYVLTINKEKLE